MTQKIPEPLLPDRVRYVADLGPLGIGSTDDITPADALVGQDGALAALGMGLTIEYPGYNVFIAGHKGTGRFTAVRQAIRDAAVACRRTVSHSYLHDFRHMDRPILITLPSGMGRQFQQAVDQLRNAIATEIPALLGSEVMARSRQRFVEKCERESARLFFDFEQQIGTEGFAVAQSQSETGTIRIADIFPVIEGEAIPIEQIEADPADAGLDKEAVATLDRRRRELKDELGSLLLRHREIGVRYQKLLQHSERRKVQDAITPLFEELVGQFSQHDTTVETWVGGLRDELLDNLEMFRPQQSDQSPPSGPTLDGFLWFVRSNLLWDPASQESVGAGCPVVEETWPTWRNLFGTLEIAGDPPIPTFLDIRAGSLLRANGGYLVLYAQDVLQEPRVYDSLKRVLRKRELEIGPPQEGPQAPFALKPQPIPIDIKVVLVGGHQTYDMLHGMDSDFPAIFKIKAEFEDEMPRTEDNVRRFLEVLRRIVDQEDLPSFEVEALEALLEESVRLSGNRNHVTTHLAELANLMREAAHLAQQRGASRVNAEDQSAAIRNRLTRHDLVQRKMLEMIQEGKVLLQVSGSHVGQINGLAYYDVDDARFGMPARISATCAVGRRGVVNIEREAQLSGSIHDKGVLILSGFLAQTFAQDKPLSLQANIAFEQSYAMVDGDSASLAELLALLSSLAGVPLRQDIAVTGSLNQRGEVQPVGGVTEKSEGFFRACHILGLTGTQGVLLPVQNTDELHVSRDLHQAVTEGQFTVWPATDVRGAIELMTGRDADEVLDACNVKLASFAETVQRFS